MALYKFCIIIIITNYPETLSVTKITS